MVGTGTDLRALDELDERQQAELAARLTADQEWAIERKREGEARLAVPGPSSPRRGDPGALPQGTVLDLPVDELSGQTVADGIASSGVLVVRGLLSTEAVGHLHEDLRLMKRLAPLILAEAAAGPAAPPSPSKLGPSELNSLPSALRHLFEAYRESGFADVLADFLGEPPIALGPRVRLQREERITGLTWHQDAAFLGGRVRAVNAWIALTPVGARCPSLEFYPTRLDRIVGFEGREDELAAALAPLDYTADHDDAIDDLVGGRRGFIPVLRPGDAVVFDEMTLHRTAPVPWDLPARETAITWFVCRDRFPPYAPFAL